MAALKQAPWINDFRLVDGRVRSNIGGDMRFDWLLITDIARWLTYYVMVRAYGAWKRISAPSGLRIWFTPAPPRPWYIVWAAATWAGIDFAARPQDADAGFYFEDLTKGCCAPAPTGLRVLNGACTDVSKSHVADVFESVFGYPLAIDPTCWCGAAAQKSERNGAHDGRIVQCPLQPAPGMVYQRLIDSEDATGMVCDLRTACIGGKPIIVFVKHKPADARFSIQNKTVVVRTPEEVFSAEEIAKISAYCAAMDMDWGALDVLRERRDGRIYIVDANKTDTGPAVILSWKDRVRVTSALANALTALVRASAS